MSGENRELADALKDMLRILRAVRFSAGLGKKQIERMEKAESVLAANTPSEKG